MSREDLARRQAELMAALVADGPVPAGHDRDRVHAQADALAAKRRRVLARLLPAEVRDHLGEALPAHLDAWIRAHPRRVGTGMRADTDAVVAALRAEGTLPRRSPLAGLRRWFARA